MKKNVIFGVVIILILIIVAGFTISGTTKKAEKEKNFLECVEMISREWCGVGQIPLSIDFERCSQHADFNAVTWCYSKFIK